MNIDEAVMLTQDHLAEEGGTMAELLGRFRSRISSTLIGERDWGRILDRAKQLPITMGAQPFGFELPLHDSRPVADFGVSLSSGNRSGGFFEERARTEEADETAAAVKRLFGEMEAQNSPLQEIVGRKLMLEYDIGTAPDSRNSLPGIFLRPNERTLFGGGGLQDDVGIVVDALVSCVGWEKNAAESKMAKEVYLAQPKDTRLDSFGVFPSRERSVRLAVMGLNVQEGVCSFLENTGWPGQIPEVDSVITRFSERTDIVSAGVNVDVRADGLGPTLGITPIVKQRYTQESRYWIDGMTDWDPVLDALGYEDFVVPEKLAALANWASKPEMLFARTGPFVLLRGIHHIKLVITGNKLEKVKAYLYMVLSGAISQQMGSE